LKLIVLDVDGVLSQGEAQKLDLSLLERLADLNRRARQDHLIPGVTLNTGRPSPYVEAVMQAIDGWQPALYESGAGMYFPQTYQFKTTPLLTAAQAEALQEIVAALDKEVVKKGRAYWQPGKTVCYTLFAVEPLTLADILPEARAVVAELSDQFMVTPAILALNIHPAHINKGTGLQWLAQETGIDPAEMGGVGDSSADVDFLRLVRNPAAPANATPEVKEAVDYVSSEITAAGLHDILNHWQLKIGLA
jgi:hydroxymethylpyrimidine pyrophosphatase-like HAD family hydrolase